MASKILTGFWTYHMTLNSLAKCKTLNLSNNKFTVHFCGKIG